MERITNNLQIEILIVDDDKAVRTFLERFLNKQGYQHIQLVKNGKEALEKIRKEDIKLVLLDMKLPGSMDGVEVLQKIKKIKNGVGVIMITGFPDRSLAKKAIKEGAYDYIVKPLDLSYLKLSLFSKMALML